MTNDALRPAPPSASVLRDGVGRIETRGIEFVPESDRHGRPSDVGIVFFGSQLTYGSIIMGALPIAFGLSVLQSLSAILVGTLLGSAGVAGMAMLGSRSGTNGVVASAAYFGMRGRLVGSFITQVIDLGYFAVTLWVCAPQLQQLLHATLGMPSTRGTLTVCVFACALLTLAIGVLGHATIVAYEKIVAGVSLLTIGVIVVMCVLHPVGHPPAAGHFRLGGAWGSWLLAVSALIANSISYAPFAGDYARYVPTSTRVSTLFGWTLLGMVAGCIMGLGAGLVLALNVAHPFSVTTEMLAGLPLALLVPLTIAALGSNICSGGMVVYNGILSLHAVLWRLPRIRVAALFGAIGLVLGYVGLIAYDMSESIIALCSIVTMLVTPWIVINIIGFFRQGGRFDVHALQQFGAARQGRYWYRRGCNVPALSAWFISVACGLPFAANSLFIGPIASRIGGLDLSFIVSAVIGAATYILLERAAPDRRWSDAEDGGARPIFIIQSQGECH